MTSRTAVLIAVSLASVAAEGRSEPRLLARWSFDGAEPCANAVAGAPACRVEKAVTAQGREGKAMGFEDWSIKDYLRPDVSGATRLVVAPADASGPALSPPFPFRVSAWIYPTADPVYYGGIVEKGAGYGGAYRLVLTRGLKVSASLGDKHVTVRSQSALSTGQWHEVAFETDGRVLTLFVDGKEAGRADIPAGAKMGSGSPLVIGERFTGRIDDIAITAL